MPSWYQLGLFLVLAAKWLGGKVLADDLVELCTNNPEFCQSLLSEGKIQKKPVFSGHLKLDKTKVLIQIVA